MIISKQAGIKDSLVKNVPNLGGLAGIYRSNLNKKAKRRLTKWGLLAGYFFLVVAIAAFVVNNRSASQTVRANTANTVSSSAEPNPLDLVSSAQIALQAAQMTKLAELTAVRNQADSERALLAVVPSDTTTLAKPQVVSTAQKSKNDIKTYVSQAGDTPDSLAAKFNVTAGSISGSNNITGSYIRPGTNLFIPPANGIVYKVKAGDDVNSIANKYGADRDLLVAVNDAENGVKPGENIWIPNVVQPGVTISYARSLGVSNYSPTYGSNGYDYGYCTWYVASRIAVPTNWGNANTWDDYARHTPGWAVNLSPSVGAIAQSDSGYGYLGHVAVVDAVSADGTQIKYSDMNGLAGWGRVGHSDWVSASSFQHYIVH